MPSSIESPHSALVLKVVGRRSGKAAVFMKLRDVYPECLFLISGEPQLHPLFCLQSDCHRNQNCMEPLARRVNRIFDTFDDADLLLLYFTHPDMPSSHRAGVFKKDMSEPRYIVFNRSVWEKLKQIGVVYSWNLPNWMSV